MGSIGKVADARVLAKLDKWTGSRVAWANWSFVMKAFHGAVKHLSGDVSGAENSAEVVMDLQHGGVQSYFVLIVLCTGRGWNRIANHLRGVSARVWRLLFQACSLKNDARLVVTMTMVEQTLVLGTNDMVAEAVWESSLEGASESSGGAGTQRSCADTTRDREHPNVARCRQSKGSRMVDNKRSSKRKLKCKRHKYGKFGLGVSSRETSAFAASEELGRDETRRHGKCRSECAGDRSSVVAREKSRDSEWNRIVCRGDCVRCQMSEKRQTNERLQISEKLHVLFGSECSKGDRHAPHSGT